MARRTPQLADAVFRETMSQGLGENTFEANKEPFGIRSFIKLCLEFPSQEGIEGERAWFSVVGKEGDKWVGCCNNDMVFTHLHGVATGDEVLFEPRHVYQVHQA